MDLGRIGTPPTGVPIAYAVPALGPVLARRTPVGQRAAFAVNPRAVYVVISARRLVEKNSALQGLHVGGIVSDSVSIIIELPHIRGIVRC